MEDNEHEHNISVMEESSVHISLFDYLQDEDFANDVENWSFINDISGLHKDNRFTSNGSSIVTYTNNIFVEQEKIIIRAEHSNGNPVYLTFHINIENKPNILSVIEGNSIQISLFDYLQDEDFVNDVENWSFINDISGLHKDNRFTSNGSSIVTYTNNIFVEQEKIIIRAEHINGNPVYLLFHINIERKPYCPELNHIQRRLIRCGQPILLNHLRPERRVYRNARRIRAITRYGRI